MITPVITLPATRPQTMLAAPAPAAAIPTETPTMTNMPTISALFCAPWRRSRASCASGTAIRPSTMIVRHSTRVSQVASGASMASANHGAATNTAA